MTTGANATKATTRAWGVGSATISSSGAVLDAHFRRLGWGDACPAHERNAAPSHTVDARRGIDIVPVVIEIDTEVAPRDATDVYLRLHLLSHRLAKPRTLNLDGVFGLLTNVAWTSIGPVALDVLDEVRDALRRKGEHLTVNGVDKFPRMTDYVMPSGVRIADASRVRLGAHLAEGTTVMHEGFCNFNAGTLGVSMVEGRISAGVIVGDGSDIGGGAS
ncbi:MAG: 2,3,4,5-tetrahydropyridine-2,6-dicarboxylate N-succinyltransferase, partial [Actinomycetota bacterium]